MNNFYERCLKLRDFYLKTESDNTKIILLSKIVAISFYNNNKLDDLPRGVILYINCYDLDTKATNIIEDSLRSVLSDLHFKQYHVERNSNFYISHEINFVINDV